MIYRGYIITLQLFLKRIKAWHSDCNKNNFYSFYKGSVMLQKSILIFIFSVLVFSGNAHFMSRIWPQKGLTANDIGSPNAINKVLIAGKESEFRDSVLSHLVSKLHNDSVFIRIIDLKDISTQDPHVWSAMLLVNMCVAWDYDNLVKNFIKKHSDSKNILLFTTSGDPNGCIPTNKSDKNLNIDGYSSASVEDKIRPAADTLYTLLKKHFNQ
jgi:hypothetical protein